MITDDVGSERWLAALRADGNDVDSSSSEDVDISPLESESAPFSDHGASDEVSRTGQRKEGVMLKARRPAQHHLHHNWLLNGVPDSGIVTLRDEGLPQPSHVLVVHRTQRSHSSDVHERDLHHEQGRLLQDTLPCHQLPNTHS